MPRNIKQELANELPSSPTIPNTSSRAQTISSSAQTPAFEDTQTATQGAQAEDSDATMSGVGHEEHDGAMHSLGAHSHRMIQGIKKLEALNISATLQSLPKFVVVGDQSAGKSSIVEALCDISLPRSQGTCTRCPFLITTSSQSPSHMAGWTCNITIKQCAFYHKGKWSRLDATNATHFATVTEKRDLEPMLRKAQLAVLNPRDNPQAYVNVDLSSAPTRQVAFSPNIISLEIQSPHLPELSFYDLPGTIRVIQDDEDSSLVGMIESLVESYLEDEKSLILLACGADQDVETSTTLGFIRACKATQRCAGVLTKADLLQPDRRHYIQQVLNGKFGLGQGWFITKQLSQAQIDANISHAEARELEATFFRGEPWSGLLSLHPCYGISNLQQAVSRSLTKHIRGELPKIIDRVSTRLQQVSDDLTRFPERPIHPTVTVNQEIQQVVSTLASYGKGEDGFNTLQTAIKKIMTAFKKQITDMKPELDYKTPGYQAPSISLDSDDEPETPTPARTKLPVRSSETPASSRKRHISTTPQTRRVKADPAGPAVQEQAYTLDSLRHEYEQGNSFGVPETMNPKVTDRLTLEALSSWNAPIQILLYKAADEVHAVVRDAVNKDLNSRSSTTLFSKTHEILNGFIQHLIQDLETCISYLLACEQEKPVTFSRWSAIRNNRQRELEQARRNQRTTEWFDTKEANSRTTTTHEKRMEKAKDANWYVPNLGDDEYAREIGCFSTITTYYDTATMCFVDTVAKHLEVGLSRPLRMNVMQKLVIDLNAGDAEACAQLLAEDPARERQRVALLSEQGKLEKAMTELRELQG